MITDPENPDEQPQQFDEPILAASLEEAQRICRLKADQDGVKLVFDSATQPYPPW